MISKVSGRPRNTQSSGFTTANHALTTENSTYEVGESSRRTKMSKRPTLQSRTPIIFNLDDDGHVRKVYDKYVGVSQGIIEYYLTIISQFWVNLLLYLIKS